MRLILVLAFLTFAVILAACKSVDQSVRTDRARRTNSAPAPVFADGVRRVTTEELDDMLAHNEAFVVDVRSEDAFKSSHIRGAKLIPENEIGKRANELPKDKLIVTYCA